METGNVEIGRKEKRKAMKKMKRKQCRKQAGEAERLEEEARLQDPVEQLRIQTLEEELEELERKQHEEEERQWLLREQQAKEEFERKQQKLLERNESLHKEAEDEDYEDGPSELIWEGNEITVIKHKVKVDKAAGEKNKKKEAQMVDRPTSNPPPPQLTSQRSSSERHEFPNYGTEQDKTHCPFYIKTGACRFGARCSRVHVYPEKSCTLLIRSMYAGPGLAWEHDEGLERMLENINAFYTDEEVKEQFEEFYEDVHSEFLKFGEIVNFKVCRNSSPHLRGNVYVHYKSEESAVAACFALSGRFFGGKQIIPEYVGVTKWKVALCGDYLKPHQGACSRGSACNFLHCFRNPGGEYDWADRDGRPPWSWRQKMASLFGYEDVAQDSEHHRNKETDRDARTYRRREIERDRELTTSEARTERHRDDKRRNSRRKTDDEYDKRRDEYHRHRNTRRDERGKYVDEEHLRSSHDKHRKRSHSEQEAGRSSRSKKSKHEDSLCQESDRWQGGT